MNFVHFLTLCVCVNFSFEEHENSSLKLVHVFFRHGSRTPEVKDLYPKDPYKFDTFQPYGWGGLTKLGKARAYKLGELLRRKYDLFLGNVYIPDMVLTTTTDFDRTKMSGLLVLAGLFPPAPSDVWNDKLAWLPIVYNYTHDKLDYLLRRPNSYCPTYAKELKEVLESEENQLLIKNHRKTFEYVSNQTGREITTTAHMFSMYQTLSCESAMNLTLPEWTKSVYPKEIHFFAAKQCEYEHYNEILKRLNGGRMLSKVIENMVGSSKGTFKPDARKIMLYSAHENNVISILAALNLFEPHVPKFSAAVMIELHYLEDSKKHAVKVYYARDVNAEPEEMKLEGCDVLCPLSEFIQITRPHVPVNYTAECHSEINLD